MTLQLKNNLLLCTCYRDMSKKLHYIIKSFKKSKKYAGRQILISTDRVILGERVITIRCLIYFHIQLYKFWYRINIYFWMMIGSNVVENYNLNYFSRPSIEEYHIQTKFMLCIYE